MHIDLKKYIGLKKNNQQFACPLKKKKKKKLVVHFFLSMEWHNLRHNTRGHGTSGYSTCVGRSLSKKKWARHVTTRATWWAWHGKSPSPHGPSFDGWHGPLAISKQKFILLNLLIPIVNCYFLNFYLYTFPALSYTKLRCTAKSCNNADSIDMEDSLTVKETHNVAVLVHYYQHKFWKCKMDSQHKETP